MSKDFARRKTGPGPGAYNLRMLQQRTLKSITRAVGVGLHSGQKVEMTLRPAAPDTGIVFRRVDLPQPVDIPVGTTAVSDTRMASTISPGGDPGGPRVQTIQHGRGLKSQIKRAQRLGGKLRIDSQPGMGTRLSLRLPVERRDQA